MSIVRRAGVIVALAVAAQVAEAQVVGTFNGAGSASLTKAPGIGQPVTVTFGSPLIAVPTLNGIFGSIAPGTTGIIQNVVLGTGAYNVPNFIQIGGFTFALDFVPPGTFPEAGCEITVPAAGQVCSPVGTPLNLSNVSNGHGGLNSSLSFAASGEVTVPSATSYFYSAVFTSQFTNLSYQDITNALNAGGTVPMSYSLTIQATQVTAAPEPATLALLAPGLVGLVGVGMIRRRRERV